ncbi:MAG: hypothetical protein ACYCX2_02350 [Christensenellales bacterium]
MVILYLIPITLFVLSLNILTQTYRLRCLVWLDESGINAEAYYLYPLCRISLQTKGDTPEVTLRVFGLLVYKSKLHRPKKTTRKEFAFVKSAALSDIAVDAYYGLHSPFMTGIFCGAFSMFSRFFNIDSFSQHPDFIAEDEYIYVEASANINLWHTMLNYAKSKNN